jgi:hypothetical protein
VWTLRKGAWSVTCVLTTHVLGWELTVRVGDELVRSEVCKQQNAVFDVADAWKSQWTAKGWTGS